MINKESKKSNKLTSAFKHYKWIFIWAGISIAFLIFIHIAFHIIGPKWLQATWGSGEILTYVSTVSLGLLAMWQNQKLQEISNKKDEYNSAVEHFALFSFGKLSATFNKNNSTDSKEAKNIEKGFNGNKAIWKTQITELQNFETVQFNLEIQNIGKFPATDVVVIEATTFEKDSGLCGFKNKNSSDGSKCYIETSLNGSNDKKYILNGESGRLIIDFELCNSNTTKQYNLMFRNPFGSLYMQKIIVFSEYREKIIELDAQCYLTIMEDE